MKKFLFITLIFVGVGFFHNAQAEYVYKTQADYSTQGNGFDDTMRNANQRLGDGLIGELHSIKFRVTSNSISNAIYASVGCTDTYSSGGSTACEAHHGVGNTFKVSLPLNLTGTDFLTFAFTSGYEFNSALFYTISFWNDDSGNGTYENLKPWGSPSAGSYSDGECIAAGSGDPCGDIEDLYFELNIVGDSPEVYFRDQATLENGIMGDFSLWDICFRPGSLAFDEVSYKIQYGDTLSEFEDDYVGVIDIPQEDFSSGVFCKTFNKLDDLDAGAKVARIGAYIDGDPQYTSDIWHFTINDDPHTSTPIVTGGYTEAIDDPDITPISICNQPFPVNYICRLFVPNEGFSAFFDNSNDALFAAYQAKVPFAYYEELSATVLEEPEGEETDLVVTLPFVNETEIDLPIVDTENEVFIEYQESIFPWISIVLWFTFVWYLLIRGFYFVKGLSNSYDY